MELNIDKGNWTPVKLGDVLTKREENDKENAGNRFDRFLKVNNMDAESLHIKRWESQENGDKLNPTFYKIFRKGQILFPTRNPHLHRTVLASFDGICGEKTLTLEPKEEFILPQFMPFLFHSESFYAHTTGAIIGSTNPHCRWRDVAKYEFLLPPKDQQAQLAKLLWTMDEVIERENEVLQKLKMISKIKTLELINGGDKKDANLWDVYKLKEVAEIKSGGTPKRSNKTYWNGDINFVKISDMTSANRFLENTEEKITQIGLDESSANLFPKETVLFAMYASIGEVVILKKEMTTSQAILGCVCNSKIKPSYLWAWFKINKERLIRMGRGATQSNLNAGIVRNLEIKLPNIEAQVDILTKIENYLDSIEKCSTKIASSKSLQKSLINQIF